MSGNTQGAKETFGAAKKAFNDSKINDDQNSGQVDDNQEEAGSFQDTARSSGKGKEGARKAKNAAKRGKKFFNGLKGIKSLAPLVSVLSTIGIALLIIFLIIGFIGFFTTLPGLAMEKIAEICENFWNWFAGAEKIEVGENDLVDLANYIQELGYELVGSGFATKSQVVRNKDTGEVTAVETDYEGNLGDTPNYLYAYVLQNERMYTLRGVEETGVNKLLSCIPILGSATDAFEEWIRNGNYVRSPSHYGMLYFDDMGENWLSALDDFDPSIDRANKTLKIKTGFWNVSQMNWDLDGWTGRYGKPIELSLALHLSTMAPDFVYDFCMDNALQTQIELGTKEMEYTADYKFISNDGVTLTREQVIQEFETHVKDISINNNYNALFLSKDKIEEYSWDFGWANQQVYTPPIEILNTTNIICVANDEKGEYDYYKALDKDGNPIELYDKVNKIPKLYTIERDDTGKPIFIESEYGKNLCNLEDGKLFFSEDGSDYTYVMIEWVSFQDMINILDYGTAAEKLRILCALEKDRASGSELAKCGIHSLLRDIDDCINYMSGARDIDDGIEYSVDFNWYQPDEGYWTYFLGDAGKMQDIFNKYDEGNHILEMDYKRFSDEIDVDNLCKDMKEALIDLVGRMNQDIRMIETYMEQIIAKKVAEFNKYGLDAETFFLLYKVMRSQDTSVHTFKPYINKVTNHWYKDVYFHPDDDDYDNGKIPTDWESAYDFTKEIEDDTGEYNPEGLANTEDIQKLKQAGKIMYTLNGTGDNGTDVTQIKQPFILKTEPWHNKVKNWLTSGYFFIYDGTKETAEEIEAARKVLKNEYNPADPLLISSEYHGLNDKLLIDSDNNEKPEVAEIDARAKELNDILASTEYKDGKKYKVRLQKINFAKKSSLAAFSILESVHTKDGEYVYRDLKEFMIELGYFSEGDFETIESNVLDWIIPSYTPDEWPDTRYEKKNDRYGTYIRSKASIEEEKQKEKDDLAKLEEQDPNDTVGDGTVGSTNSSGSTTTSNGQSTTHTTSGVEEKSVDAIDYGEEGYATVTIINGVSYKNYKQGNYPSQKVSSQYSQIKPSKSTDAFGRVGCGPTSTAVVLSAYGKVGSIGKDALPYVIGEEIGVTTQGTKSSEDIKKAFDSRGIAATVYYKSNPDIYNIMDKALKEGRPIIANVNPGSYSPNGHYIAILGYDSNNKLVISNPYGYGIYGNSGTHNPGEVTLQEFINKHLGGGSQTLLIPDIAPAGTSLAKSSSIKGFDENLDVIAPEQCIVINKEIGDRSDSITIKFTSENKVKDMTMKIEGIKLNDDIEENKVIDKGTVIGKTTKEDIKLLMRDAKKAIINNIEDYMQPPEKLKKVANGGGGTIPLFSTSLSRQEFIDGANNYSGIAGTEFDGKMGEFYDICTKNGINPVIAFTRAIWESGLTHDGGTHNYWGINIPNGSGYVGVADSMLGTLQVYCDLLNSYSDPTTWQYKTIMERYNERKDCTENGGCNTSGYGTPDTIEGIMSLYSSLGIHEYGNAGDGGYYYLDPDRAGVTYIYETHEEFVSLCKNQHSEGSSVTVWENAQYTAYQVKLMADTAENIWGEKALE
ncbi:MAG: C39 family peptidase [Clostridia bacterium]|nr:C39 family peptidase [Clostridia bacterium]